MSSLDHQAIGYFIKYKVYCILRAGGHERELVVTRHDLKRLYALCGSDHLADLHPAHCTGSSRCARSTLHYRNNIQCVGTPSGTSQAHWLSNFVVCHVERATGDLGTDLLQLTGSFQGQVSSDTTDWVRSTSSQACTWSGVSCIGPAGSQVLTGLNLAALQLTGERQA